MNSSLIAVLTLALCGLLCRPAAATDYYIVVSESNATRTLSGQEVLHIFMGRTRSFPDGVPATRYELADATQRAGFYRTLADMSLAQVTSYWARLMFSGRNLPPQQVQGEAALLEKVRRDPHAITWLPAQSSAPGVRTVLVLRDGT
ncbi:MAG TPA: hypothetical protein VNQ32_06920 [Steroidobacteraceae bacterium]|nr:hypothetical protein [Steroidobacteraceae bacterium]